MLKGKTLSQKIMSWEIKHLTLTKMIIVCCVTVTGIVYIPNLNPYSHPLYIVPPLVFGLLALGLYMIHKTASRFRELLDVLQPNLLDVGWVQSDTLKFTTTNLGEFYLSYFQETDREPAHYLVWISSDKGGSSPFVSKMVLWRRPYKSIYGKWMYFDSPTYVPVVRANDIKTLKWIALELVDSQFRIIARLKDEWLESETGDLLRTIELLEEIYAGM